MEGKMSSELTPDQQLLLWHLGLKGGKALQMEIEYKQIAKDRKELERRGLIAVAKQGRSLALQLKEDGGWDELSKPGSILPKGKKKPSRERAILQLLLNAFHSNASRQRVSIGEILRPAPNEPQPTDIEQRIRHAFFEIAGNPPQDSVRLSALRAKLHDVPRQRLDETLLAMKSARDINLMNLDNTRDIKAEETSALHDGNRHYHVLWIER
jgi:hypothetical protein